MALPVNLSKLKQDAITALILAEIADDRKWEQSLDRSPGKLATLASRAVKQVQAGQCRTTGFDELN